MRPGPTPSRATAVASSHPQGGRGGGPGRSCPALRPAALGRQDVVTEDAALSSGAAEQSIPPSKGPGAAPVGVQQRVSAACLLGPARAGRV